MTKSEIEQMIENPRYAIYYNGKEVKRYPFYKQARNYCLKHNSRMLGDICELLDLETGEIINNLFE